MANYAIGDIQGCYEPLLHLLDKVHFNEHTDRLWLVGDLVNRGPQSLEVLRFLKQLPLKPIITLGNHDLHLLNCLFNQKATLSPGDTLQEIIKAEDGLELGHWLRHQPLLHDDPDLKIVMSHAGIAPMWDLTTAKQCAREVETVLQSADYVDYLIHLYGNTPAKWDLNSADVTSLTHFERLRLITNYFTRMRFCDSDGGLLFDYKGIPAKAPAGYFPWYALPHRLAIVEADIVFGHWAALEGYTGYSGIYALDTGCVWGKALSALRLEDRQSFSVSNCRI